MRRRLRELLNVKLPQNATLPLRLHSPIGALEQCQELCVGTVYRHDSQEGFRRHLLRPSMAGAGRDHERRRPQGNKSGWQDPFQVDWSWFARRAGVWGLRNHIRPSFVGQFVGDFAHGRRICPGGFIATGSESIVLTIAGRSFASRMSRYIKRAFLVITGFCAIALATLIGLYLYGYLVGGTGSQLLPAFFPVSSITVTLGMVHIAGFSAAAFLSFILGVGLCAYGIVPAPETQKETATDQRE